MTDAPVGPRFQVLKRHRSPALRPHTPIIAQAGRLHTTPTTPWYDQGAETKTYLRSPRRPVSAEKSVPSSRLVGPLAIDGPSAAAGIPIPPLDGPLGTCRAERRFPPLHPGIGTLPEWLQRMGGSPGSVVARLNWSDRWDIEKGVENRIAG